MAGDRYRRVEIIGSGGMATVWRGEDTELGRSVAIKQISEGLAHDETFMRRFEREAKIASSLTHPGLVRVYDYEPDADRPFIVMELLEGGTLADLLRDGAPVDVEQLAVELLSALGHIHAAGIVHRDVKPANVLIDDDGAFRLTDFGIASADDATRFTRTGNVVGTLRYMAPEVKAGEPAGPGSDLYAAGILLTDAAGESLQGPLAGLVAALTATDRANRPADAAAALALLEGGAATAVMGAAAPTPPTDRLAEPPPPRRTLPFIAGTLGLLAALALAGLLLFGGGEGEPAQTQEPDPQPPTTTVTQTTTEPTPAPEPAPEQPQNPAGKAPPGLAQGADDCEGLEQRKDELKDEEKAAEEQVGDDKDAKKQIKEDYKAQEQALDEQIKACKEGLK